MAGGVGPRAVAGVGRGLLKHVGRLIDMRGVGVGHVVGHVTAMDGVLGQVRQIMSSGQRHGHRPLRQTPHRLRHVIVLVEAAAPYGRNQRAQCRRGVSRAHEIKLIT